jgi:hypothetical protein
MRKVCTRGRCECFRHIVFTLSLIVSYLVVFCWAVCLILEAQCSFFAGSRVDTAMFVVGYSLAMGC